MLGGLVVLAGYGALCAVRLVQASRELQAGASALQAARANLEAADLADPHTARELSARLQRSAQDFAAAQKNVGSTWLLPLHALPYVGRQVSAVEAMSMAAATITSSGSHDLTRLQSLLAAPRSQPSQQAALVGRLAFLLGAFDATVSRVDLGPSVALFPPIAAKHNEFARDLAQLESGLRRADGAAAATADLLNGNRTYLVFMANNAEMRDGSGTLLQVGTLSSHDGQLTLGSFQATQDLVSSTPLAPLSTSLAANWGSLGLNQDYRELDLSPQYPANAKEAAAMWTAQTGQHVDGVLTVDVAALQQLLTVTGPVQVDGTTVTATNAEPYLFVTEYDGVTTSTADALRRQQLGQLANAVFSALQHRHVSPTKLVRALLNAADGRHLLVWSDNASVQADWQAAGVTGQVSPDGVLLGTINKGVNKLDPYQQVEAHLSTAAAGSDTRITIRATLANHTPNGLPSYTDGGVIASSPPGYYTGALALDLPRYAGHVTVSGGNGLVAAGRDGPSTQVAQAISVSPGGSVTVTWTFLVTGRHGSLQIEPSARVPPIAWSAPGSAFVDTSSHAVTW